MALEDFIAQLNSLAFFNEFTFSKNKFSPDPSRELELADNLIWLGDYLAILQLKERQPNTKHTEASESKWFQKKIITHATKQIRDSLTYLNEHPQIRITNQRGHSFNIAAKSFKDILKVIVYMADRHLPADCKNVKSHVSKTAGFIHIVPAEDYLEICRTLRVPGDILDYFSYRESIITQSSNAARDIPEPILMGQFLSGNIDEPPSRAALSYLYQLIQDDEAFNLSGLLNNLHNNIQTNDRPFDYYRILTEFARVPRSVWREIKTRFLLCMEKTEKQEFASPYRLVYPATACGFVLYPVDKEIISDPDSPRLRVAGLKNFTYAHMYEQKLERCIGISIGKEGQYFLIDWCFLEFPWAYDAEMEKNLAENYPFRKVQEKEIFRFRFS